MNLVRLGLTYNKEYTYHNIVIILRASVLANNDIFRVDLSITCIANDMSSIFAFE